MAATGWSGLAGGRPKLPIFLVGVRWSTEHALADTLAHLRPGQAGPELAALDDVDDAEAWRRWRGQPLLTFTSN
jgi:hypothetical protein